MTLTGYAQISTGTDTENRHKDDFYPTWPAATKALLAHEQFQGFVWEPACGAGDMSRVLREAGYLVTSTDLHDHGYGRPGADFLAYKGPGLGDVITNPPFKHAQAFIEKALSLPNTRKVAMFLRLAFLEGQRRKTLFESTPLKAVYIMSRRVPMQRGRQAVEGDTQGPLAFAWFVWCKDRYPEEDTILKWIDWKDYE
jgi:hypothetical protein